MTHVEESVVIVTENFVKSYGQVDAAHGITLNETSHIAQLKAIDRHVIK